MSRLTWVLVLLAVMISAVALIFGLEIGSLRGQLGIQQQHIRQEQAKLSVLWAAESRMSSQLASLTVPTDPLASYDAVCNQQMTNNLSGITQTYYFPCTNNAQTIPQPSGG